MKPARYGTCALVAAQLDAMANLWEQEPSETFQDPDVRAEAERCRDILERQLNGGEG